MGPDEPDAVTVVRQRHGEGRPHDSRAEDYDGAHGHAPAVALSARVRPAAHRSSCPGTTSSRAAAREPSAHGEPERDGDERGAGQRAEREASEPGRAEALGGGLTTRRGGGGGGGAPPPPR